ncbi:MAG: 2OG-Fe(II) oxygenase [Rhodospirillaceae bacterium]|nr:2OG-Fe(II) oxygenase [Rhodospirillaceae bacterium]|tara:strand:- start:21672 stop:22652 length:981 start_codon:yes stop_codon:yes gene_type:complete
MTALTKDIPVLDLGPWMAGDEGALDRLAADLRKVCMEVGFYFITNHGVPQGLVDRTFEQTAAFHNLPAHVKAAYAINRHNIGYMAPRTSMQRSSTVHKATKPNLVASYFMKRERSSDDPVVVEGLPLRGLNQWPDELPDFRGTMLEYMTAMESLGKRMLPVYARALELETDFFAASFREPSITLRISHYPAQDNFDGEEFGTGPHTDAGFMTMLAQADVPGLEILLRDGRWHPAPVLPGAFLVNIGQMLTRWTNDIFPSTPHRVVNLAGRERFSIPFFFDPDFEATVACLPTCQGTDNPPRHEPIRYLDHILAFTNRNFDHRGKAA